MNVVAVFMFSAFVVVAVAQLVKLTVAIKNSWRIGELSFRLVWVELAMVEDNLAAAHFVKLITNTIFLSLFILPTSLVLHPFCANF